MSSNIILTKKEIDDCYQQAQIKTFNDVYNITSILVTLSLDELPNYIERFSYTPFRKNLEEIFLLKFKEKEFNKQFLSYIKK